jgi:hypothetical protein
MLLQVTCSLLDRIVFGQQRFSPQKHVLLKLRCMVKKTMNYARSNIPWINIARQSIFLYAVQAEITKLRKEDKVTVT